MRVLRSDPPDTFVHYAYKSKLFLRNAMMMIIGYLLKITTSQTDRQTHTHTHTHGYKK